LYHERRTGRRCRRQRRIGHHRLGEPRLCQILPELASPRVDQAGSNVVTPRHIGNAGARRKRLVQDLKPRLSAPPPPPLRPGKNRDLSHRLLLAALSRATLRALARDLDKAASAGGILHILRTRTNTSTVIGPPRMRLAGPKTLPMAKSANIVTAGGIFTEWRITMALTRFPSICCTTE